MLKQRERLLAEFVTANIVGRTRGLVTCALLVLASASSTAKADTLFVDTLDLSLATQGWATTRANQSSDGNPITLGGTVHARGIGTHSNGTLAISLAGTATRFNAIVGVDDEVAAGAPLDRSKVQFRVADERGRILFESTLSVRSMPRTATIDIDVTGLQTIYLMSGTSDDTFQFDHADWANATITYSGTPPVALALVAPGDPLIATPTNGGAPRFNGASIYGVRTGTPIVHTVAVSGSRPMTFSATGLPAGVTLDPSSGRLSGTLAVAGSYEATITATNASGSASRAITLVIGDTLARTPPMGWNSYDAFGDSVTEAEVLANATFVRDNLLQYGWDTVVVDYRWYDSTPINNGGGDNNDTLVMDANGRLQPATNRFPSATGGLGFGPLAAQVHAMGLRFGIHIMRGIPQDAVQNPTDITIASSTHTVDEAANTNSNCRWLVHDMYGVRSTDTQTYYGTCYDCSVLTPSTPATAAQLEAGADWYASIVDQYAAWGVDFIKADDMSSGGGGNERAPYSQGEIDHLRSAIEGSGRSIVLSLSPGETPLSAQTHLNAAANMWRISDDFWDRWNDVEHIFSLADRWKNGGTIGHWPDADMLPLGYLGPRVPVDGPARLTRFTRQEQLTMMSLWAVLPSPYMLGANLASAATTSDAFTMALLQNPEVIDIHQDALGARGRPIALGLIDAWVRDLADGSTAVALFNRTSITTLSPTVTFASLGLTGSYDVRNVWQRSATTASASGFTAQIGSHGAALYRLSSVAPPVADGGVGDASMPDGQIGDANVMDSGDGSTTPPRGGGGCATSRAAPTSGVALALLALLALRRRATRPSRASATPTRLLRPRAGGIEAGCVIRGASRASEARSI